MPDMPADLPIDLRSDTVTRPDDEMRRAMATAEVGDDVYGEDPTVAALEASAAVAVGHEAALFVPSGTMGNQIALRLLGTPGQEVICDARSHMLILEMGAMSALSGLLPRAIDSPQGLLDPAAVEAAVCSGAGYRVRTCLLAVENTHNLAGGSVYGRPHLEALLAVARRHGLPAHLDGARIFNAAVALGTTAAALAAGFSSTMFCLSKGLGAPVGSLLCGGRDLIREGRRVRKMFGGGMRQAGVLAAAGLVALRRGPAHLAADHAHAALLAAAVATLPDVEIDAAGVRTNIVVFRVSPGLAARLPPGDPGAPADATAEPAAAVVARLRAAGVLATPVSRDQVRMVTHRDAGRPQIDQAILRLRQALAP
ncbi:MAG TPA: GntG family PLP-dependent aldolase [Thermoanaerobaculia bacterium]|nr:GntG family PLP-dependent aldolase [Thermoanaerobaculia bacterium]